MMKNKFKSLILSLFITIMTSNLVLAVEEKPTEAQAFGIKFFHVILGVILSISVIYVALFLYKNFKGGNIVVNKSKNTNNLISSETLDDAIEHFIKDSE